MNSQTTNRTSQQARRVRSECCTELECETGLRNNYFDGKRLTPDSFQVEQKYMLERRHLLNRAIHGWGVVYGYGIAAEAPDAYKEGKSGRFRIGAGLALDPCGRELLQHEAEIEFDDVILLEKNDKGQVHVIPKGEFKNWYATKHPQETCWLLSVHYAEQKTDPVPIKDPCECEHHEWDHTCERVRYSLQLVPRAKCCEDFGCELNCKRGTERCCEESIDIDCAYLFSVEPRFAEELDGGKVSDGLRGQFQRHGKVLTSSVQVEVETGGSDWIIFADTEYSIRRENQELNVYKANMPPKRGGCHCMCDYLTRWAPETEYGSLCEIKEPCAHVRVDVRNGVPLACVDLVRDDCDDWAFGEAVETCGPRRLVKRNDLLFDLIRGCDLTYIRNFGWKKWHRQPTAIPFPEFADGFAPADVHKADYVTRDFWVEFSRPVRRETVRQDCFVMTIISSETDDRWWEASRVPIVRVEMAQTEFIEHATIVVDGRWLRGTIRSDSSRFQNKVFRVEIEVRGDFIVDCNGQTVDANAHGLSNGRTGNGTPGGTFVSTFLVEAAPESVPVRENIESYQGVS